MLRDPSLASDTFKFCKRIRDFQFQKVFENALKRTAWLHTNPELFEIEAKMMHDTTDAFVTAITQATPPPTTIDNFSEVLQAIELENSSS